MLTTNITLAEKYDYLSDKSISLKSIYIFKRNRSCITSNRKNRD